MATSSTDQKIILSFLLYSIIIIIVVSDAVVNQCPSAVIMVTRRGEMNRVFIAIDQYFIIGCQIPSDCRGWRDRGFNQNGAFYIKPDNGTAFQVLVYIICYLICMITYRYTVI